MTVRRLEVHPGAREDYLEALDWYLDRSIQVARRFQEALINTLERVAEQPELASADVAQTPGQRGGHSCLCFAALSPVDAPLPAGLR